MARPRLPGGSSRRAEKSQDTTTLAAGRGRRVPAAPGQFNMVYAFGLGEVAISISGQTLARRELVHTVGPSGESARAGAGPRRARWWGYGVRTGTAGPIEEAHGRDVLVIGGGRTRAPAPGHASCCAAPRRLQARGLICGARTHGEQLLWPSWPAGGAEDNIRVQVTVDSAGPDRAGDVGVVTQPPPGRPVRPGQHPGVRVRIRK